MKTIAQFIVSKEDGVYTAEGVDLAIITEAESLDRLVQNVEEATALYFEDEQESPLSYVQKPAIFLNYEVVNHA